MTSPWIKGATPDKPDATNINARKRRYFGPWNLGRIVIKMVNVPKSPIYQTRKKDCQTQVLGLREGKNKTMQIVIH